MMPDRDPLRSTMPACSRGRPGGTRRVSSATGEFDGRLSSASSVVLLGFTGGIQWRHFAHAPEAQDRLPDPLDRWSRRIIGALAREFDAFDVYPSASSEAPLPFQRLALRCEPVHQSPIGLLIHPNGVCGMPTAARSCCRS